MMKRRNDRPFWRVGLTMALVGGLVSCRRAGSDEAGDRISGISVPQEGFSFSSREYRESDFTAWMSKAELQVTQDRLPQDMYLARVEGRLDRGRTEYRGVMAVFPRDRFDQWAVMWGLDEDELFEWEVSLLRAGFQRQEMQVFADSMGRSLHQMVWLQPRGVAEDGEASVTAVAAEPGELADEIRAGVPESAEAPGELSEAAARAEQNDEVSRPAESSSADSREERREEPSGRAREYVVRPGDTLSGIAKRYGVSVAQIKRDNGLRSDMLRIGQKLSIKGGSGAKR
ncbi:LysM repeat protein [Haloferula luteola]|uniref:LysM repeat protein n=2 Tax=Haloferula luteola TaxID=595692 RepID=A0A840VCX9_9BACT|nr:LysM repeat protein [Haloferula luteola]